LHDALAAHYHALLAEAPHARAPFPGRPMMRVSIAALPCGADVYFSGDILH